MVMMKTLLLMRHAKSSWKEDSMPDHDRPLNKRGRHSAPQMGKLLQEQSLIPDLVISSTAVRALSTAEAVLESCHAGAEIQTHPEIYDGDVEDILEILRTLPDEAQIVLLVGHNPGMEVLAEMLCAETVQMPTAAIARIELQLERWQELSEVTPGRLNGYWAPRELG